MNKIPNSPTSIIPVIKTSILSNFCGFVYSIINLEYPTENDKKLATFIERDKFTTPLIEYISMLIINIETNDPNGDNTLIYIIFMLMNIRKSGITINYYNINRLLIMSFVIVTKMLNDYSYINTEWAFIVGLNTKEINLMEKELMILLDFNIFIKEEHIKHIMKSLL